MSQLALGPGLAPPESAPPVACTHGRAPFVPPEESRPVNVRAELRRLWLERVYRFDNRVTPSLEIPRQEMDVRAEIRKRVASGRVVGARAPTDAGAGKVSAREILGRLTGSWRETEATPKAGPAPLSILGSVAAAEAAAAALLVTTRLELPPDANPVSARRIRSEVRRGVRRLYAANSNLRKCGERRWGRGGVQVRVKGGAREPRGVLAGLIRCASVHSCVKCAPRINATRAEIVKAIVTAHRAETRTEEAPEGAVYMLTLTVPHTVQMRCRPLRAAVSNAWKRVQQGKSWRRLKDRIGFVGSITAREITHGGNGWHPHLHILLALARPLTETQRHNLEATLYGRWVAAVLGVEELALEAPSWEHGISLLPCYGETYITKLGLVDELLGALHKKARGENRTPFQVMMAYAAEPNRADARLLREYFKGMKRARQLTWSRGSADLRKVYAAELAPATADQADLRELGMMTDQELLLAEEREGAVVARIPARQWDALVRVMRAGGFDAECNVVTAAEQDGARGVEAFLAWALYAGRRLSRRRPELARWLHWLAPPGEDAEPGRAAQAMQRPRWRKVQRANDEDPRRPSGRVPNQAAALDARHDVGELH